MNERRLSVSESIAAYVDYVNGLPFAREHFDIESLEEYEADMAKAKAEMERTWLEKKPVNDDPS